MISFAILAMIIGARVIWQIKPSLFTCLLFWQIIITVRIFDTALDNPAYWLGWIGLLLNAIVTIANGGFMPVREGTMGFKPISLWVRSTDAHRFRFLADNYAGFSIGDFFIGAAMLYVIGESLSNGWPWR